MSDRKLYRPWSARTLVEAEGKVVLVLDPHRDDPYWIPPGGTGELFDRNPKATAKRELHEETGLWAAKLTLLGTPHLRQNRRQPNQPYHLHFFRAELDWRGLLRLAEKGNEGEIIKLFDPQEVLDLPNFHPLYRPLFIEHSVLLKPQQK